MIWHCTAYTEKPTAYSIIWDYNRSLAKKETKTSCAKHDIYALKPVVNDNFVTDAIKFEIEVKNQIFKCSKNSIQG